MEVRNVGESVNSFLKEERKNKFEKPKKKFFSDERKKKMKTVLKRFFIIVGIALWLVVLITIGMSADYHYNEIYDEYEELDKETEYIVNNKMKEITIEKNVYVNFLIVYKDIGDYFYEDKIDQNRKYVAVIYNAMDKKFHLKSNLEYLVKDITKENVDLENLKDEIPSFFDTVKDNIKENVYLTDYDTITNGIFNMSKDNLVALTIFITVIAVGLILIIKN